jgi:hypothetical protein
MTTRNKKTKRTTVYLDPVLLKAMRYKALINETSVSEMINDAIRNQIAEDTEDIEDIEARKNESLIPFEEVVKRLKLDGLI